MLCGFDRRACKHRGCEAGLKHWGWVCAFGSCFSVVLFVVRSLGSCFWSFFSWFVLLGSCFWSFFSWFVVWVRAFGRSFRGSCFWSFFWSFFSWFVLGVRAFGRSFRGSFFCSFFSWFVLLGARMCFLFDALKVLEACVARSEVS